MAKDILFAIVFFSIIYFATYKFYHAWLNKNYRNNKVSILKWVYRLVILSAFISFLWGPYPISDYMIFTFKLSLYAFLCVITFKISDNFFLRPKSILLEVNSYKEEPSEEINKKAFWLKEQMISNHYYLNSELTLKSLADNLNIHPNALSKVINDGLNKNFSDFVNEYRVNAIIEKLHNDNYNHITLLGISFECGFNSKTTFNRVFKKIKGITPLNYKKLIKNKSV